MTVLVLVVLGVSISAVAAAKLNQYKFLYFPLGFYLAAQGLLIGIAAGVVLLANPDLGLTALALIAGALLGLGVISSMFPGKDPEAVAAVSAFVCMVLSLGVVKLWSRKAERKSAYKPVVVEILDNGGSS